MANKKQLDYTQVKGIELTIIDNPYGERIVRILSRYIHHIINDKGQYVFYYYDRDGLDGELEYAQRRGANFKYAFKSGVQLYGIVPEYLTTHEMSFKKFVEWMGMTTETEYDMSGKHSAESKAKRKAAKENGEVNEWGEPLRYDFPRVYSVNEIRVNWYF